MQKNQKQDFSSVMNGINKKNKSDVAKNLMANMSAEDNKQLFEILNDKEKLAAVLNSPAAQSIMKKLNGQHQ